MATTAVQYARALKAHSADADGGAAFTDRLIAFLLSKKRGKLLSSISTAYERMHTEGAQGATLVVARGSDATRHAEEIRADLILLNAEAGGTAIDDSLIGGYIVRTPTHQVDKSYRSALLNLYNRITN